MTAEKKRYPRIIIEGVSRFPSLVRPDTRFDPEGVYKCDLRVRPEDATQYIEKLERIRDEYLASLEEKVRRRAKVKDVYIEEVDAEDNETGFYLFRTKVPATITTKDGRVISMRPRFFDVANNLLDDDQVDKLDIWSGSVLAIQVEVKPYMIQTDKTVGVTLRPKNVQLLKIVSGETASPFTARGEVESPVDEDSTDVDDEDDLPF